MTLPISAEILLALTVPAAYGVMVAIETCGTGWRWPPRRRWQLVGMFCFAMLGVINAFVSSALKPSLARWQWMDGSQLGVIGGAALGYAVLSLGNAMLHRAYHRHDWLWRYVHQLHHAPTRLDVAGVMFQTPIEMAANAVLFVLVTVLMFGLDPLASMLCACVATFYGMFQHFNMHTPRWLGYFIQRPEAHCEHHRRGVHAGNYSDLPIWDMLWGTYHNPRTFTGELGFEPATEQRVWAMLAGHDVNGTARRNDIAAGKVTHGRDRRT